MAKPLAKSGCIVGENLGVVRGAGHGNISEAGIDKLRRCFGVHVDEDALGGHSLGTVRGHGVSVVEMPHVTGVEHDGSLVLALQPGRDLGTVNLLNGRQIAVGDSKLLRPSLPAWRRGRLLQVSVASRSATATSGFRN